MATKQKGIALEGVPDLTAALQRVQRDLVGPEAEQALMDAGRLVADEWAQRVPVGESPHDPHPGAYRRAMESADAVRVTNTDGKLAMTIGPAPLPDLPYEQQPHAYAGVLEYGDADQPPQPSARAAWEAASPRAVEQLGKSVAQIAEHKR